MSVSISSPGKKCLILDLRYVNTLVYKDKIKFKHWKCFEHYLQGKKMYLFKFHLKSSYVAPWCSGYHYCKTSFDKDWTQALCRFKSCLWRVGDSRWWGSLTVVPVGSKAKRLSSVHKSNSIQCITILIFSNLIRTFSVFPGYLKVT